MRKVILYVAMSLDGFIADANGNVEWLEGDNSDEQKENNYSEFEKTVDTILMGYTTYYQIVTELSPDQWPYKGMQAYIFTHRQCLSHSSIHFTDESIKDLLGKLKSQTGKNIWVCGGANLINQFMEKDCIDLYHITIIPCILGKGIRLFNENAETMKLKLLSIKSENGMVDLIYERRQ